MHHEWQPKTLASKSEPVNLLLRIVGCVLLLPLLACLSDASSFDPPTAYEKAKGFFVHGYLQLAKQEAESGYRRALNSDSNWSTKFQTLEVTAMVWAGDDTQALQLLAERPMVPAHSSGTEIELSAVQAMALVDLGRVPEANRILQDVDSLCEKSVQSECGYVMRAHGYLFFNQGNAIQARQTYFKALEFSRLHHDRMFEATVLTNLADTFSLQEQHDQALLYNEQAYQIAMELGSQTLAQTALGNEGQVFYSMGNPEKALELYTMSLKTAIALGDKDGETWALTVAAQAYADMGEFKSAESFDLRAIKLGKQIDRKIKIINASEDLAQVYVSQGRAEEAVRYTQQADMLVQKNGSEPDILLCHLLYGEAAALRHDWGRADGLLHEVAIAPGSQNRMRWTAQHTLATMYEAQGQMDEAEQSYKAAIGLVEGARKDLKQEVSRLTFLNNAASIYDDYIHFLVVQGRTDEALEAADWSRARTLQQGLGVISTDASLKPPPLRAKEIAGRTNATLLFYWLGEKQSFVWAVSPEKTTLVTLPMKSEIVTRMERYRKTLLALKDPLRENDGQGNEDGRALYEMLVAPVAGALTQDRPVVLFTDGEMSQLNFETLIVDSPEPHYWIEDATISSAPSIRMLAGRDAAANVAHERLLLVGDSLSDDPTLPRLPMADLEVQKVQAKFALADEVVFSGPRATPHAYLASKPEQFAYIHFVAHGSANNTDPLESAVDLSKDGAGEDSYKLYAREILQHPISARLVTISACNSSGTKSYVGEGVVGLSWAFLRAGAHNTIGALWDVSDASTPELMDRMYSRLQQNETPAVALREAKLSLLHAQGGFNRPFYWAPFQLYSGR